MPTDLPERRPPRNEVEEMGRKLGVLIGFGFFVAIALAFVWMLAYTAAHAVKTCMGM